MGTPSDEWPVRSATRATAGAPGRMNEPGPLSAPERSCPVCDQHEADALWTKGVLRAVRCRRCTMIYARPVAQEFASGEYYARSAVTYQLSPDKLEGDFAPVRFERELRLFRARCRGGAVLDVGCSTGGFLSQLCQRWPGAYTVVGTDVASAALDHAERRGIPVVRRAFADPAFSPQRFDAVTFWAVLEHLDQPRACLRRAAQVLRPGGHGFILVPNARSLAVRLLGSRYRYVMPEHVNYFSPSTLRRFVGLEPDFRLVALSSTHFNPVVLWQDLVWRREAVPEAERAALLRRTTGWKQHRLLAPARWVYALLERALGRAMLADNLVAVLQRRGAASPDAFCG